MKKYLLTIIGICLLLVPTSVNAERKDITIKGSKFSSVGGYFEIVAQLSDTPNSIFDELKFEYNSNVLSISKDDIIITSCNRKVDNTLKGLTIDISNGKLVIKSTEAFSKFECKDKDQSTKIELSFKALKEGATSVRFIGENYNCGDSSCDESIDTKIEKPSDTEAVTYEDTSYELPVHSDKELGSTDSSNTVKCEKCDNTYLYISLGVNGVVLVLLVVFLINEKKKRKEENK